MATPDLYVLDESSLHDVPIEERPGLVRSGGGVVAPVCLKCYLQEVARERGEISKGKDMVSTEGVPSTDPDSGPGNKGQPNQDFGEGSQSGPRKKRKRHISKDIQEDVKRSTWLQAMEKNQNMLAQLIEDHELLRAQQNEQCENMIKAVTKISNELAELTKKK